MAHTRSIAGVIIAGAILLSVGLGIRQTFGLFIGPIAAEHLVNVRMLSIAIAIQNLTWGLAQPLAGGLCDRFGPGPVVAAGGLLYGTGLLAVALHPSAMVAVLAFGILIGLGQASMTFAVVISSISRASDTQGRATAVALAAAGGSLGQVALIPLAQIAINNAGFHSALIVLAAFAIAITPLGFLLRRPGAPRGDNPTVNTGTAIRTALRDGNFLFLTGGFFACGFQLAFMGTHLPGYLAQCHLNANVGAAALSTIGFFNIIGSFAFGRAADKAAPQFLLFGLYTVRATATLAYLIVPVSALTTLAFAVVMGLTWLGTVPLTNAVIARLHGLPNLGALFGVCFVGHQLGGFLGVLAGGLVLEATGSYLPVWIAIVAVGYIAALLNLPISYRNAAPAVA